MNVVIPRGVPVARTRMKGAAHKTLGVIWEKRHAGIRQLYVTLYAKMIL